MTVPTHQGSKPSRRIVIPVSHSSPSRHVITCDSQDLKVEVQQCAHCNTFFVPVDLAGDRITGKCRSVASSEPIGRGSPVTRWAGPSPTAAESLSAGILSKII